MWIMRKGWDCAYSDDDGVDNGLCFMLRVE